MEQILYRARRLDNGEFYEGASLMLTDEEAFFAERGTHGLMMGYNTFKVNVIPIDIDTICRGLGRTDATGKEIFEGDVLRKEGEHNKLYGDCYVKYGEYEDVDYHDDNENFDTGLGFYLYFPKMKTSCGISVKSISKFKIVDNK